MRFLSVPEKQKFYNEKILDFSRNLEFSIQKIDICTQLPLPSMSKYIFQY